MRYLLSFAFDLLFLQFGKSSVLYNFLTHAKLHRLNWPQTFIYFPKWSEFIYRLAASLNSGLMNLKFGLPFSIFGSHATVSISSIRNT